MITLAALAQASAANLVSLTVLKEELGVTGSGQDALLTRRIAEAGAVMAKSCGRLHWASTTAIEVFEETERAGRCLWLSHWPVTAIASVVEDGITLASGDYELDGQRRLFRLSNGMRIGWPASRITVSYTGGYDLSSACPPDLAQACVELIRSTWTGRTRDPLVKAEEIPGVIRQEYWVGPTGDAGLIPASVEAVLANYRNLGVG